MQVLRDKLAGEDMVSRLLSEVGNLFDRFQIHQHIDEDRAARRDSYVPLSDFFRSTLCCWSLTLEWPYAMAASSVTVQSQSVCCPGWRAGPRLIDS